MSGSYSPYTRSGYTDDSQYYNSPSPTPSPRPSSYMYGQGYPQRPATRAHFRTPSQSYNDPSSRPPTASPRYTSDGHYATKTANGGLPGYTFRETFDDVRQPRPHTKRRSSVSTPQRPATVRPTSSHKTKPPPPAARVATESDRARHKIPQGYSIKNWDPSETPILLLGSVFDANSLGKWIFDWTVYHHGSGTGVSDTAGQLWLLLIEFAGKVKSAEDVVDRVRSTKNKEIIEDFIAAGERLSDRLEELLKTCEAFMLKASKRKDASLGKNAGVEFVETLFSREVEKTQKFMKQLETFIKRFGVNCDEIIKRPTM